MNTLTAISQQSRRDEKEAARTSTLCTPWPVRLSVIGNWTHSKFDWSILARKECTNQTSRTGVNETVIAQLGRGKENRELAASNSENITTKYHNVIIALKTLFEAIKTAILTKEKVQPIRLTTNCPDQHSSSYIAIYADAKIIQIFESTSPDFLAIAENNLDYFRTAVNPEPFAAFSPSLANNIYSRATHEKTKRTIINARNGGELEAVRRSLLILPFSFQCWSTSPYFDKNIFSYDEKWISPMERPKPCPDCTVR